MSDRNPKIMMSLLLRMKDLVDSHLELCVARPGRKGEEEQQRMLRGCNFKEEALLLLKKCDLVAPCSECGRAY